MPRPQPSRLALLTAALVLVCQTHTRASDDPPPQPALPTANTPAPSAVAPAEIPDTPAGRALKKLLASFASDKSPLTEADFSPVFLKQVPLAQVEKLTADLRAKSGALTLRSIEPGATERRLVAIALATTGKGAFRIPIAVDEQGRIEGLFIAPAPAADTPALKSWGDLDARLRAMSEDVSFAAYELLGKDTAESDQLELRAIHELNAATPLAVGSTFKLYILGALAERIGRGEAAWDTELPIQDKLKSLPSGVMQNEKDGTKFPVKQFALKMISISDNTATDHLLFFVGREQVEAYFRRFNSAPERSLPFLGTREMFAIKLAPDRTLAARYALATEPERRAMLAPPPADSAAGRKAGEVFATQPSIALASFWLKPVEVDRVEWFVSTRDACRVMAELNRLSQTKTDRADLGVLRDILGANPGIPLNPKVWKHYFYKGGSEPGVLNLTWLLERNDGRTFTLSMTLNDTKKAFKDDNAIGLAARAIELLEAHDRR